MNAVMQQTCGQGLLALSSFQIYECTLSTNIDELKKINNQPLNDFLQMEWEHEEKG